MEEAIKLRRPLKSIMKNGAPQEKKQSIRFAEPELKTSSPITSDPKRYTGQVDPPVRDGLGTHDILNTSPIKSFAGVRSPVLENLRRQRMPERQIRPLRRPAKKRDSPFSLLGSLNNIGSKFMETILQNEPSAERRNTRAEPTTEHRPLPLGEARRESPQREMESVQELKQISKSTQPTLGFKEEVIAQLAELRETVESLSQKVFQIEREKQELAVENMLLQNSMQDMRDRLVVQETRIRQYEGSETKAIENDAGRKRRHEDEPEEMQPVERKVRKLQEALEELKQSKTHKNIREEIRKNPINKY